MLPRAVLDDLPTVYLTPEPQIAAKEQTPPAVSPSNTCPYCGAETRPGDNFCLNCGNRLLPSTPSPQQDQRVIGDATLPAPEDWVPPTAVASPPAQDSNWADANLLTVANTSLESAPLRADESASSSSAPPIAQATL